jgi:hypothetical protein
MKTYNKNIETQKQKPREKYHANTGQTPALTGNINPGQVTHYQETEQGQPGQFPPGYSVNRDSQQDRSGTDSPLGPCCLS